jgi:hypothetical protein
LKPIKTSLPTSQGPCMIERYAIDVRSPTTTAAPDFQ